MTGGMDRREKPPKLLTRYQSVNYVKRVVVWSSADGGQAPPQQATTFFYAPVTYTSNKNQPQLCSFLINIFLNYQNSIL